MELEGAKPLSTPFVVPDGTSTYNAEFHANFDLPKGSVVDGVRITPQTGGTPHCYAWIGVVYPKFGASGGIEYCRGYVAHPGTQGVDLVAFPKHPVGNQLANVRFFVDNDTGADKKFQGTLFYSKPVIY